MPKTYEQLQSELDDILLKLQADNVDIDSAFELHKNGQAVVKKLEAYLKKAEVTLKTLKP